MKVMNERHDLKMHGHEPDVWPQTNPNSYQPLAGLCGTHCVVTRAKDLIVELSFKRIFEIMTIIRTMRQINFENIKTLLTAIDLACATTSWVTGYCECRIMFDPYGKKQNLERDGPHPKQTSSYNCLFQKSTY